MTKNDLHNILDIIEGAKETAKENAKNYLALNPTDTVRRKELEAEISAINAVWVEIKGRYSYLMKGDE